MALDLRWEDIFRTRAWGKYPPEEFIRFMAANFYRHPARHEVKVFEAGFGTGANLWYAAREGFTVFGLEGAQAGCDVAQRPPRCRSAGLARARRAAARGRHLQAAALAPTPASMRCSTATPPPATATRKRARLYREMHRVAKAGGRLYVRTPAAGCWGEGTGTPHGRGRWECAEGPFAGTGVVRFTTEDDLRDLLADWRIEQLEEVTRTLGNRAHVVREWVVSAVKA